VALLAFCAVLGGTFFNMKLDRADPTVELTQVSGIVLEAHRAAGRAAVFIAHVRLDDGREIDADSVLPSPPAQHERVLLSQSRHASGKVSHHVLKMIN
jgi:hypothetical protein